jgi:hypothetical protein
MQLIILTFLLLIAINATAQEAAKDNLPPTEIDFLFSYYQQDGDSSAVTGGLGTEELKDIASIVIVNIPLKYNKELNLQAGVSYYTSASSDQIDPNTISSASSHNLVFHVEGTKLKRDTARNTTRTVSFRATHQFNFVSFGTGTSFSKTSSKHNSIFTFTGNFNYDKWAPYYNLSKLYPKEIRFSTEPLPTDTRYSLDADFTYTQVINKKMQAMVSLGAIYQWGLLSTPFHRVYFEDQTNADLERLPDRRIRVPMAFRLNYYVNDLLLLRTFYRYYFDNFGINAHTIQLEAPFKISNFFSIYPYYRYYTQSESTYFAPYKIHTADEPYYTSDYDLSDFQANMIGGGIRFSPPLGIRSGKKPPKSTAWLFKTLEFRYGQYRRSNGLKAHIFSLNMGYLQ